MFLSILKKLFSRKFCLIGYVPTKVVSAIIKIKNIIKNWTISVIFHVSQASQDDSLRELARRPWPEQGATEREKATRELSRFMKSKKSKHHEEKSIQLRETSLHEIPFSMFGL